MKESNTEKYIGDVISADGSNDENIKKRVSQGIGTIAQIFSILSDIGANVVRAHSSVRGQT